MARKSKIKWKERAWMYGHEYDKREGRNKKEGKER